MRKFAALLGLVLFTAGTASAQSLLSSVPASALGVSAGTRAAASPALPAARRFGGREDYRWQVSLSYSYVRFRSSQFNATYHGINTSVARFLNDWFAIEGEVTPAFGTVNNNTAKFAFYGGGARIARRHWRRWEPWIHGVVGGVHVIPQTAGNSQDSVAYEFGGGTDWTVSPRLGLRFQADWVRSQLFHQNQNNLKIASGFVFSF